MITIKKRSMVLGVIGAIASLAITSPVLAANRIIWSIEWANKTYKIDISIAGIERFVKTGDTSGLPPQFSNLNLSPDFEYYLRTKLNTPITSNSSLPLHQLENILMLLFPTSTPELRKSALNLMVEKANGKTTIDFLKALPVDTITADNFWAIFNAYKGTKSTQSGKIVIANDEWTFSNKGFAQSPDADIFITNIAKWFAGDKPGKFHAYSTNFGLTQFALANTMTSAGNTWTTGLGINFDLPTLLNYDGIFLAGNPANNDVLIDYVKAGGNVYLAAGTYSDDFGNGSPANAASEAARWNGFLNNFGLGLAPRYSEEDIGGLNMPINSSHPIFAGVSSLFQDSGSETFVLDPSNPATKVLATTRNGAGLYAVYDSNAIPNSKTVPEPSSVFGLLAFGTFGMGSMWRRKRQQKDLNSV